MARHPRKGKVAAFTAALGRSSNGQDGGSAGIGGRARDNPVPGLPPAYVHRPDRVPTTATQIRMGTALYEAFRKRCFERRESQSFVIEQLVREWLARPESE